MWQAQPAGEQAVEGMPTALVSANVVESAPVEWMATGTMGGPPVDASPPKSPTGSARSPRQLIPDHEPEGWTLGRRQSGAGFAPRSRKAGEKRRSTIRVAAWDEPGAKLLSGSSDNVLRIFDTRTGAEELQVAHSGKVTAAQWSPTGAKIATGSGDQMLRIIDVATGAVDVEVEHDDAVCAVCWNFAGTKVATGSYGGEVAMFNAESGRREWAFSLTFGAVHDLRWCPRTELLAVGGADGKLCVIDSTGEERLEVLNGKAVRAISWHPDGQYLATGGEDERLCVVDAWKCAVDWQVPHGSYVVSVAWAGAKIATGCLDFKARIFDFQLRLCDLEVQHLGPVWSIRWSPSGEEFATGSAGGDHKVRIINPTTGVVKRQWAQARGVTVVDWSP